MPSSTSSFRKSARRARKQLACLAAGAATFIGLGMVARLTATPAARQMDIAMHAMPPASGSYYLAHDRGGHIDHHVLFHGIDKVALSNLRQADVLFLGNSRLMFALNQSGLQAFFKDLNLRYYVLGFGHEEQDDFPARIIRKYDLRPSFVVVNVDGFFWDGQSDWASKVMEESAFDAWKLQWEAEASHVVRRRLHAVLPHYVDLKRGQREFVIYRSRLDGSWFVANDFGDGEPFRWPVHDRTEPSSRSKRSAEEFKLDVESRGAKLILVLVPAPHASAHRAQVLADHLGVPLLTPPIAEPKTIDQSHLSLESSLRFEGAFFEELRGLLRKPFADQRTR